MLAKNSLAPAVKCPNKSLTPSCFPTHPYNYINYQQRDSNSNTGNNNTSNNKPPSSSLSSYNTASQSTMLTNQSNMSSLSNSQDSSNNNNNNSNFTSKTAERKKTQHLLLDNSDTLSTHSFSSGKSLKRPPPPSGCSDKKLIDLETVTPLYENLTDSIQIHESPAIPAGAGGIGQKFAIDQERYRISLTSGRKPRKSNSRSNSAVSNSYYDCIKPIPAPRHRKYASTNSLLTKNIQMYANKLDPIYMNLNPAGVCSSGYETEPSSMANEEYGGRGGECPGAYDNHYFEITQHQTRILIPKELFPVDRSNQAAAKIANQLLKKNLVSSSSSNSTNTSSSRRHIKLPLQKHHSFNFQSSQTVEATVRDLKIKSHSISSKTLRDYRNSSGSSGVNNNNIIINSSNSNNNSNLISSNSNSSKFPTSSTNPFINSINSSSTLTSSSSSRRSLAAAARQHTTLATATLATVRQYPSHSGAESDDDDQSSSDPDQPPALLLHHQKPHHKHHQHQHHSKPGSGHHTHQQKHKQHPQQYHTVGASTNSAPATAVYKYESNSIAFKPITPVPTSTPAAITNSKSSVNNMCKDKFAIK